MASGFSKEPTLGLLPDVPSLMETLSYSYCYVGIMTGEWTCSAHLPLHLSHLCPTPSGFQYLFFIPTLPQATSILALAASAQARLTLLQDQSCFSRR
jgi:hypothetical protein